AEIDGFFIRHPGIEHFVVTKVKGGKITGSKVFTSGKVGFVDPDSKEVQAFVADADEFYASHNHPSGNATPSVEDIASTKGMAADKRFKGHVVTDHQTYTAISPDGTATAQAFKEEKQSFRIDLEKMAHAPAVVGWSRGVMQGDRLGIMFVDSQLQVMSFDQVDPRSDYNLYIKRHVTKYGANGVFLVAGEAAHARMKPRRLQGQYHDFIVMGNDGSYKSAQLGYVKGFNVSAVPSGVEGFEALSFSETGADYNAGDYNKMTGRYTPGMALTLRARLTMPQFPKGLPTGTAGKLVSVNTDTAEMIVEIGGKMVKLTPDLFKETYRKPGALEPGQKPLKFIDTVKGMENVAPQVKDTIE
ncbi:MAG: JAB domain-containing protein, partial [Deltaproteobacteria bacterium]|nr:JAB domain-containing protein [Deltaproteobacteria bacterium]